MLLCRFAALRLAVVATYAGWYMNSTVRTYLYAIIYEKWDAMWYSFHPQSLKTERTGTSTAGARFHPMHFKISPSPVTTHWTRNTTVRMSVNTVILCSKSGEVTVPLRLESRIRFSFNGANVYRTSYRYSTCSWCTHGTVVKQHHDYRTVGSLSTVQYSLYDAPTTSCIQTRKKCSSYSSSLLVQRSKYLKPRSDFQKLCQQPPLS